MPVAVLNDPQFALLDNFAVDLNSLYQNGVSFGNQLTFQSLAASGVAILKVKMIHVAICI